MVAGVKMLNKRLKNRAFSAGLANKFVRLLGGRYVYRV